MTVLISRNGHGGCRCRFRGLLVPLAPLPLMRCGGRGWCVGRMGDYQIAPKPPRGRLWQVAADAAGYGGYRLRVGTGVTPHPPPAGAPSAVHTPQCVPQGHLLRGAHWGALKGKANEDVSFDDISLVNGWYADLLCQHLDIPVAFRDTFW